MPLKLIVMTPRPDKHQQEEKFGGITLGDLLDTLQIQPLFAYRLLTLLKEKAKLTRNSLKNKWHILLEEMAKVSLLVMDPTGPNSLITEPHPVQICLHPAAGTNSTLKDLTRKS